MSDALKYLRLLAKRYPSVAVASHELIRLRAILELPKGSEHFLSDVHGEYESFSHVLRNASGLIKQRILMLFGRTLGERDRRTLATIIYYPQEKLDRLRPSGQEMERWLYLLIQVARSFASQYTKSYVRLAMPQGYAYLMEELLFEREEGLGKQDYYGALVRSILDTDQAPALIVALSNCIQRLSVSRLHIIGDVYDRGPGAERIMDDLLHYHSLDFQWGNHDMVWMAAAAGERACMANVVRVSLRYNNTDTLEDGYGINLRPLATFALEHYANDRNKRFQPKELPENHLSEKDLHLKRLMQKAIAVIQFKLEGQIIRRRPHFEMEDRLLLHKMRGGNIEIGSKEYVLNDTHFPTVHPEDPYQLTPEEENVMLSLERSFLYSERLQRHVRFLYEKGSMYLTFNGNLLLHGCVPLEEDGSFAGFNDQGRLYKGKALVERFDALAREAYFGKKNSTEREYALDAVWYLWCGAQSPIFGKSRMATFESYFIDDKAAHTEPKNAYYRLRNEEHICRAILEEFGLDPDHARIVNGHVPVVVKKGESPIKANGKLLVIDGGFAKAYQAHTGIAGYTLIYDAQGLQLVSHQPFESRERAIEEEQDILSYQTILARHDRFMKVKDTDLGKEILQRAEDLERLIQAYRRGEVSA